MSISIKNRKAYFEYSIIDTYTAGISLQGSEIKSIRNSKVNLAGSFCSFIDKELFVKNLYIYSEEDKEGKHIRNIKLLLNRSELNKLEVKVIEKGMSIIPIRLFVNDKGIAKIDIATAKGKKLYDKRHSIKEKDLKRDLNRLNK